MASDQKELVGKGKNMSESIKINMTPPHVGAFLRDEVLEPLNLTVARAANVLNVRRATLSDLLNEKARLTPEMALRVEKAFGISMDTMLTMQIWHDIRDMRERADSIPVKKYSLNAA